MRSWFVINYSYCKNRKMRENQEQKTPTKFPLRKTVFQEGKHYYRNTGLLIEHWKLLDTKIFLKHKVIMTLVMRDRWKSEKHIHIKKQDIIWWTKVCENRPQIELAWGRCQATRGSRLLPGPITVCIFCQGEIKGRPAPAGWNASFLHTAWK
jgi:hypothetical protein